MAEPAASHDHASPAAVISYIVLAVFVLLLAGVFAIIFLGVTLEPVALGVLGGLIGAATSGVSAVLSYWIGASVGGKTANAALAQLAGAGPPPPSAPLESEPAPHLRLPRRAGPAAPSAPGGLQP